MTLDILLAYWPIVLGLGAIAFASWAGFSLVTAIGEMRDSDAGRIRSRVRDLGSDEHGIATSQGTWLEQIAAAASSGWPSTASRLLEPVVRVLDRGGIALDGRRLGQAGLTGSLSTADMIHVRAISGLVLGLLLGLIGLAGGILQGFFFVGIGLLLGARIPSFYLAGLATGRDRRCTRDLPEMADMLALGVKAGMSFDRALALYVERFDGPLSEDFAAAQNQWVYGALSRDEALDQLTTRISNDSVTRMVAAIQQALRLGSPLAKVLEEQSRDSRAAFKAKVEEQIGEAPVKMLMPMGALILPAMLILLLAPIMISVLAGG